MKMKPLMLMRKRGLLGPSFGKYANLRSHVAKSVGAYYDVSGAGACPYKMTVGAQDVRYGYLDGQFGAIDPTTTKAGVFIKSIWVTVAGDFVMSFGASGNVKPTENDSTIIVFEGFGGLLCEWNEATTQYEATSLALYTYLSGQEGEELCVYSDPDYSNYYFWGADYTTDDYLLKLLLVGAEPHTTTHASPMYAPDHEGVMQLYNANTPVWQGARVVLSGGAGTNVVEAYADDEAGAPLDPQPMLVAEGFSDESQTIPETSVNTYDAANHSNTRGPMSLTFDYPAEADMDVLSLTEGAYLKVEDDGGSGKQLTLTDQTNSVSLPMPTPPAEVYAAALYEQGAENSVLNFDSSPYGSFSEVVTLSGDFEIEVKIKTSVPAQYGKVTANSNVNGFPYVSFNAGAITFRGNEAGVYAPLVNVNDGVAHTLRWVRTGTGSSNITAFVDDVEYGVNTSESAGDITFDMVGSWKDTIDNFLNSILYYVKFTGVSNPSQSVTYTFDSGSVVEEVSDDDPAQICTFTRVDASNWLQGEGQMQLKLNSTFSDIVEYDNEFGTGDLVVGATSRSIKRWNKTTIDAQKLKT